MALAAAHKKIQSVVVSALLVHAGQEIPAEAVRYIYIYKNSSVPILSEMLYTLSCIIISSG